MTSGVWLIPYTSKVWVQAGLAHLKHCCSRVGLHFALPRVLGLLLLHVRVAGLTPLLLDGWQELVDPRRALTRRRHVEEPLSIPIMRHEPLVMRHLLRLRYKVERLVKVVLDDIVEHLSTTLVVVALPKDHEL